MKCWVQEFSCTCFLIHTRAILLLAPLYRWRNWGSEWLINSSTGTELGSCRDGMQKLSLTLNPLILPQKEDRLWRQKQMSLPSPPPDPVTSQLSVGAHQQGCPLWSMPVPTLPWDFLGWIDYSGCWFFYTTLVHFPKKLFILFVHLCIHSLTKYLLRSLHIPAMVLTPNLQKWTRQTLSLAQGL